MRHETIQVHTRHARPAELHYLPERATHDEAVTVFFRGATGQAQHLRKCPGAQDEGRSEVRVECEGDAQIVLSVAQLRRIVDEGSRILAERDARARVAS